MLDTFLQHFYNTMYKTVADNLGEMILNSPMQYQAGLNRDLKLNNWSFLSFSWSSSWEIIRAFHYFYFLNRRFPAENDLINVPKGIMLPDFIQTNNEISPLLEEITVRKISWLSLYTIFLCFQYSIRRWSKSFKRCNKRILS